MKTKEQIQQCPEYQKQSIWMEGIEHGRVELLKVMLNNNLVDLETLAEILAGLDFGDMKLYK